MPKIRVVIFHGNGPEIEDVDATLASFQQIVGGYLEAVSLHRIDAGLFIYCNEDGLRLGLRPNADSYRLRNFVNMMDGSIRGPFMMCRVRDGQEVSLTDDDIKRIVGSVV